MRPSPTQLTILRALHKWGPSYGLELVRHCPELHRGSVYVMLRRLRDNGLLSCSMLRQGDAGERGPQRRYYYLTPRVELALDAEAMADNQWSAIAEEHAVRMARRARLAMPVGA